MNAHNFIFCMNSKDFSEEVKDALKCIVRCEYFIKNICGAVLQTRECLFGKPNSSTQKMHHCIKIYPICSLQTRINESSRCQTCSTKFKLPANYNICKNLIGDHMYAHDLSLNAFLKQYSLDQLTDKVTSNKEQLYSASNKLPPLLPEQKMSTKPWWVLVQIYSINCFFLL